MFLTGCFSVIVFYFIGLVITSIFRIKDNNYVLTCYGCLVFVVLFAIFFSKFHTVLSAVILLFILVFFLLPIKPNLKSVVRIKTHPKVVLKISFVYFLSFIYFVLIFVDLGTMEIKYLWYDNVHYATVSRGMSHLNCENITVNFFTSNNITKDLMLWHYFDLWLNVAINKIASFGFYNSLVLVVYPILQTTFLLLIYGFFQPLSKNIFLFFFIMIVPFSIKTPFIKYEGFLNVLGLKQNFSSVIDLKLFIVYIMVFVSGFMYINKRYISALIFLGTLSLIYVTTFISILPSVLIFLLTAKFLNNKPNQTFKTAVYIYLMLCFLHLFLLYINNPSNLGFYEKQQIEIVSSIKTILVVFAETITKYTIVYAPSLIVIVYSFLKLKGRPHFRQIVLFFLTMLLTAIFVSSIFHGSSVEFGQSLYNIAPPIFITLLIFSIYFLFKDKHFSKASTYFILFVFSINGLFGIQSNFEFPDTYGKKYSIDYKKKVLNTLSNTLNPKYITIANSDLDIYKQPHRSDNYIIKDTATYLNKYFSNRMDAFLSNLDNVSLGHDLHYLRKNNSKSRIALKKHIQENQINYVFIEKGLKVDINYFLIAKDSLSGELFAQINKGVK